MPSLPGNRRWHRCGAGKIERMKIAEIFYSIQGEGKLVGIPSVFVRVSGCNLRCTWCDTPYASWQPDGKEKSVNEIVEEVMKSPSGHVVLTGGEPMMFKETVELIGTLKHAGKHVTVETAGTLWLQGLPVGGIDLASVSPKLSNSTPKEREGGRFAQAHERGRIAMEVLKTFATGGGGVVRECQWKFVISREEDLQEMEELLARLNSQLSNTPRIGTEDVVLMPEGTDAAILTQRSQWLAEVCKERGYRLSPRLHVYLWGNRRGT
jgi:7-carboxy-7-deazaguanine synthase